jgi:hypothetical protein
MSKRIQLNIGCPNFMMCKDRSVKWNRCGHKLYIDVNESVKTIIIIDKNK